MKSFDRAFGEWKRAFLRASFLRASPLPDPPPPHTPDPAADDVLDIGFEERMATVEFRVAPHAHIVVDGDVCRSCTTKECVTACPANLFVPTADGGVLFNYEQCFECGTCYMVCNKEGALTWTYPVGGRGVVMRRS
jgi:ferredoxin like protein